MSSHSRVFDIDPVTGRKRIWHWDATTESFAIETLQDVTMLKEMNQMDYNHDTYSGQKWKGDGLHKVASIPNNVLADLRRQGIAQDPARFRAWLNAPENRVFRTKPGKV